jgi:hypothetical protein
MLAKLLNPPYDMLIGKQLLDPMFDCKRLIVTLFASIQLHCML